MNSRPGDRRSNTRASERIRAHTLATEIASRPVPRGPQCRRGLRQIDGAIGADPGCVVSLARTPRRRRVGDVHTRSRDGRWQACVGIDAAVSLTKEQFRYGFGDGIREEESDELFDKWAIPSPGRPLFQAATPTSTRTQTKVDTKNEDRGPLLLTMGGKDHTVPEAISKSTYKQYRHSGATTELAEFADRGHSLTIDHGGREIADSVLSWLKGKGV